MSTLIEVTPCSHHTVRAGHFALALVLAFVSFSEDASAADTAEPFELGLSNAEAYLGYDGFPGPLERHNWSFSTVLGYGLTKSFSGYSSLTMESSHWLTDPTTNLALGLFWTPVSLSHFDIDLMAEASSTLGTPGELGLTPSFELNFYRSEGRDTWGLFMIGSAPIAGSTDEETGAPRTQMDLTGQFGVSCFALNGHELFMTYEWGTHQVLASPNHLSHDGSLALGYNIILSDRVELIQEAHMALPFPGEKPEFGAFVGFIGTMVTGASEKNAP